MTQLHAAIAVMATRYALGRHTGAPQDVRTFAHLYRKHIVGDAGCRRAMQRDITKALESPDLPYRAIWLEVLGLLAGEPQT